jgi:hypothetical protein
MGLPIVEYVRRVELSSSLTTAEATSKTVDFRCERFFSATGFGRRTAGVTAARQLRPIATGERNPGSAPTASASDPRE